MPHSVVGAHTLCDNVGFTIFEGSARAMTRNTSVFCFLVLAVTGLAGCSSEPPKQAAAPPDKIHGKAEIHLNEATALDAALNAGGPSVYLVDGLK